MFQDGVLYAAIAHNLARGMGSFWYPYLNDTVFPFFHQQPPLTFGIQSLFFRVLGDSIYVERFYSFLTLLVSAWLVSRLWRCIYAGDSKLKNLSWLPVILWIIIPVCLWSYSNNMEENSMGIFALLSILFTYKGLNGDRRILYLILGGINASLAFLCNGFPGLFVIALPFLYRLCIRSFPLVKMMKYSFIIIGTIILVYACVLINQDARNSLYAYLHDRVINSILHVSTVDNRFHIIGELFFPQLLPPIFLCLAFLAIFKWMSVCNSKGLKKDKKLLSLFFFIGLSASLPLIVTMEQRESYLVTSLPYFAIAFSITIAAGISELIDRIKVESTGFKMFRLLSIAFLFGGILYSLTLVGKIGRDKEQLQDIYTLGKIIPPKTTVRVYTETWQDFGLHNYLARYFNISMTDDTSSKYKYFIVERKLNKIPPSCYSKISLKTANYDLYEH
jgi:4-amino-4-deoxy-L-arabinose transferase-like glycosyltransferase